MSLPSWVLPFKEPHTAIKYIKGCYYKYAVSHQYDPARKRTVPKSGVLLGKITEQDVIETREEPANSPQLVKAIKRYQGEGKVWVAYEAGCLGFDPYHFLGRYGIACQMRHGFRYENNRYRGAAWMGGLKFEQEMEKETFEQYLSRPEDLTERIKRMEKRIAEVAQQEEYREQVQKLRAFRGIDYLTALALLCEIGDFRRFPSAGAFMSYPGLVPSEFSSGGKRRQGRITKAGNSHIRKLLTESSWHYPRPV
ncbi:MAG: transposase, partial [Treponema sp.]|nr:transposase [Treponema sp.]